MKIGITSKGFTRWGEERYKKLKELGFSTLDFGMANTETDLYTCSEKDLVAMLAKEKALADAAGFEIFQVHGPWRFPIKDDTAEDRAERMEKMKKSIRATALLGCKNWIVHPIMPLGVHDIPEGKSAETWELNVQFMRELVKTAREYDVTICLENMPFAEFSLSKPAEILRLIEEINDDHFRMCLDTGHVNKFPELSLGDEVRKMKDVIRTFHIHDNNGKQDQHAIPYFGTIDWEDFGKALRDIHYDGSFSFEVEPAQKLPDHIYEEMLGSFVTIAKHVIGE